MNRFSRTKLLCILFFFCFIWVSSLFVNQSYAASISVRDDRQQLITLPEYAQRIISLAPHVTELLFSAGAGERVVGVVSYSDFPPEAKAIDKVGSYQNFDYEKILSLKPDLVVGWLSGNSNEKIAKLEKLGLTVYLSEPRSFEGIASNIERLATISGTQEKSAIELAKFRREIFELKKKYQNRKSVTLFYEIWHSPLTTLNGEHLFNEVVSSCGGKNVFAHLPSLAPRVNREAVLKADPAVILASGTGEQRPEWLDEWKKWPHLKAVAKDNLYFISADFLQRQSMRILRGTQQLCQILEQVRNTSN